MLSTEPFSPYSKTIIDNLQGYLEMNVGGHSNKNNLRCADDTT